MEFIGANLEIIVVVLSALVLAMFVYIVLLKKKYNSFIKTSKKVNIEDVLIENQNQIAKLEEFKKYFEEYEQKTDKRLKKCVSNVAIKKYNAFDGLGGELSALIVLLDEEGDGLLLNVVHTRDNNHVFTKSIVKGGCDIALSKEEKEMISSVLR